MSKEHPEKRAEQLELQRKAEAPPSKVDSNDGGFGLQFNPRYGYPTVPGW